MYCIAKVESTPSLGLGIVVKDAENVDCRKYGRGGAEGKGRSSEGDYAGPANEE